MRWYRVLLSVSLFAATLLAWNVTTARADGEITHNGPAFLAYPNFKSYTEWNAAIVYATTAAYFATRLAGAPKVSPGNAPVQVLTTPQVQELQRLLIARRLLTGEADGRVGAMTRVAVKSAQLKVGLPADSYPSIELIERLRVVR